MKYIQAANHWVGREGYSPKFVIIHGTAGGTGAEGIANYFANPATQASTNYVIGTDGEVVQCVAETDAPWANGGVTAGADSWWVGGPNPNLITISIEHCKPSTDNSDQLTDAQKQASFQLVKDICQRNNIPARKADANGGITGHFSMDPVNRSRCPGPYPWDELFTFLTGEPQPMLITLSSPSVSDFFHGDDQTWNCTNGFYITLGILGFYRSYVNTDLNGLTYLGLPLSNESYPKPNTAVQQFERGIVAYDPSRILDNPPGASGACYLLHSSSQISTPRASLPDLSQPLTSIENAVSQIKGLLK